LAKVRSIIVFSKPYRCGHGKSPIVRHDEPHSGPLGNPPRES
jgi:hypothetical protein